MSSLFEKLAARPQRSIICLSLLLLLAGNWILPLTDRDEARFGEASREMLQRGDYIVPWFNDAWRFDKPVLIYWCQIASYRVLGVNDFAARLPSVLFTTFTALLLVRWGRKIADHKTAFLAGMMYVAGLHVAIIGRVATADMAMIFFSTLAAWSGWEWTRPEQPHRKTFWWIFYIALAFGFLAKGPVAWLPLGGICLGRALRKDAFRLPLNETVIGLCVTVALVALWGGPALAQTGGQFWSVGMGEHVFNRSVGVINGHGPKDTLQYLALMPLYFLTFIVSFLPWTIYLPERFSSWWRTRKAKGLVKWFLQGILIFLETFFLFIPKQIWRWWPERRRDDLGWYLLVNAAIVFTVFSLVKTKLPHYTIPAFPLIALWLARQISGTPNLSAWAGKRLVGMAVFVLVLTLGVFSFAEKHLLAENLWRAVQPHLRPETKIGSFGYTEPSQVWRFRNVTTNKVILGGVEQVKNFLTNTPPFILVLPTSELAKLPDTNGILISVYGLDLVKFKNRDLTVIVR